MSLNSEQSYTVLRARIGINLHTDDSGRGGATLEQIAAIERVLFDALTGTGLRVELLQVAPSADQRWVTRGLPNFVRP
jgi:hypothetical protein